MDSEKDWIFTALKSIGLKVPKMKHIKSSMPKHNENASQVDTKLFGVSLFNQEWTYESDYVLPKFLAVATTYLSNFSTTVGLFRKSGSIVRQRSLRIKLKNGESLEGTDPHDVASLLKQWLRELPEPLIPHCMQDLFIRCQQLGKKSDECANATLLCCLLLPPEHLYPLKHLLRFLKTFAMHSKENKMAEDNLALMLAPNIFTSKTGNVNINKNCNLVQMHASVVEVLIANADRIGEVPLAVSSLLPILDEGTGSKFYSPSEILTSGPTKLSRKLKVGPVQDVLSGIKKLVAHNTAAPKVKPLSPEKFWSSPKLLCRPVPLNDARKTFSAPLKNEVTPVFGIKSKIDCGQKKSLGFLRLKDRKGQNSFRTSSQTKSDDEISKLNSITDRMDLNCKVPTSSNESETKFPAVQFEYNDLQYGSVATCDAECNSVASSKKVFNLTSPSFSSLSRGGSHNEYLSQPNVNLETEQLESRKSESLHGNEICVNKTKTIYELESLTLNKDCFGREVHCTRDSKPEAFVAISKNIEKFTDHRMQSGNNSCRNYDNRVDLQRSKSLVDSKWRSERTSKKTVNAKICKKTTRQHSLIRGKPNTIKNGLPYQHLNKNNLAQSLEINEKTIHQSNVSFTTIPSPDAAEKGSHEYFSEQDISLILSLANLNLSPLNNNTPDKNCESFIISFPKKSPTPNKESFTIRLNKEQSSPLLSVSHSDSKIPRLSHVFDTNQKYLSKISPESKQQTPKLKYSRSLRHSPGNSRIPVLSKRKLQLSDLETSSNEDCFQTPNRTLYNSFNSSTCDSDGFLSINTPLDNYKKRESIARILKNNSGHVLKKIQLYDSKDSKSDSTNAANNICRDPPFEKIQHESPQKQISIKQSLGIKRNSIKNRIGTPSKLPHQPSKYSINIESISQNLNHSLKLKEVTNTNTDGKQNPSRNTTPVKDDKQNCCNPDLRRAKLKRNSFSGHTPSKFSKRVSRSESLGSCSAV